MSHDSKSSFQDSVRGEKGASQNVLLAVLGLILAGFGYLYFFTSLIREPAGVKPPSTAATLVKQPIPPRPSGDAAKKADQPPAAKPKDAVPAAAAKPLAVDKAPEKPAEKAAPLPVPAAPKTPAAPATSAKSTVVAKAPEKPADKPLLQKTAEKPKPKPNQDGDSLKPAEKVKPANIQIETVDISSSAIADKLVGDMKKAGFTKVGKKAVVREKQMIRLFISEFQDHDQAFSELETLKKSAPGAFILPESDKYLLFAGSYEQESRALTEKSRLSAKGTNVSLLKAMVKLPAFRVTANAPGKAAAVEWSAKLKKQGIELSSAHTGK